MKDHRDTINRLSIILDDSAQHFAADYADRFENKLQARPVQKLAGDDMRMWDYDLDGVMIELYWDKVVKDGVMIRGIGEMDEGVVEEIAKE